MFFFVVGWCEDLIDGSIDCFRFIDTVQPQYVKKKRNCLLKTILVWAYFALFCFVFTSRPK